MMEQQVGLTLMILKQQHLTIQEEWIIGQQLVFILKLIGENQVETMVLLVKNKNHD